MKQKNNHARSKQKRKKLRMKNLLKRIFDRRQKKADQLMKPKGKTIVGDAIDYAIPYSALFPDGGGGFLLDHGRRITLNQRQKRKRWKHANSSRPKKAA